MPAMLITPRILYSLPFISESLASLNSLQLTNITFVSFVSTDLNNKLSVTNQYLYCLNLAKKLFTSLSLIFMSKGLIYHICQNFGVSQFLLGQ